MEENHNWCSSEWLLWRERKKKIFAILSFFLSFFLSNKKWEMTRDVKTATDELEESREEILSK